MNRGPTILGLFLAPWLCFHSSSDAQLVARQGAPSEDIDAQEQTRFVSPMILETPLEALEPAKLGHDIPVQGGLPKYYCENVKFVSLTLRAVATPNKPLSVSYRVVLNAGTGHDKTVSVRLEVIERGAPIAAHIIRNFKVEEGDATVRSGSFEMPPQWSPSASVPTLRVTMSLKNI
jgi:hypothetical protein